MFFLCSMPKSISIFFDAVESAIHVGAVLFRFFANYQKALNVYDWKIILASNWKKLLYFTFVNSRKVEKRKEEESSFGGRSKIITQRMGHKKDTLEVAWSRIPTFIWWSERDQRGLRPPLSCCHFCIPYLCFEAVFLAWQKWPSFYTKAAFC